VDIQINSETIEGIKMKLGDNGVAYFVEEIDGDEEVPDYLATSPLPSVSTESDVEKADVKIDTTKKPRRRAVVPIR
jgi:phosphatidate phosphatase PAH1